MAGDALMGRVYPTLADSGQVHAFAEGGKAVLRSVHVWKMKPIW